MPTIRKITAFPAVRAPGKRVAAYARVSIGTEVLLHSLSAQISHYSSLIQSNPAWEYAGVYADEGVTGTSTAHRDGFNRLMADCDAGKIDLILTKSVSRFARDTVDCLKAVRHLKDIGVEVRFEREGISTFTADGELLLTLLASFAQAESESISANVKWAVRKRFEEGIPNGHKAPFGYEWDGGMFRIIPEQGEVVRYIFKRYLAGDSGYSIARKLAELGVTGQNGGPMCDSTIKDIVSNISYTGTMILQKNYISENHVRKHNRGELPRYAVEDMFEPLVSKEDFEKAQDIRHRRAEESPNVGYLPTRFSGLVKCGNCGRGVSRRTAGGKKKWVCNTRERKGTGVCDMRPLMETELEAAADAVVGSLDHDEFRRLVAGIFVFGDRIEFRLANGSVKKAAREYGGFKMRNGFSGRLFCGDCGAKLERDTWRKRGGGKTTSIKIWRCPSLRCSCQLRRVTEEGLKRAAADVLDTTDCEPAFVENVRRAVVFNDSIRFELKEGEVKTWRRE